MVFPAAPEELPGDVEVFHLAAQADQVALETALEASQVQLVNRADQFGQAVGPVSMDLLAQAEHPDVQVGQGVGLISVDSNAQLECRAAVERALEAAYVQLERRVVQVG